MSRWRLSAGVVATVIATASMSFAPSPISGPPRIAAAATAEGFVGVTPARILDTRSGLGAPAAAVVGGTAIDLQVTGRGGVPESDVVAVVLNVTVTAPTTAGYITVWPTGSDRPTASNLNFVEGQSIPNLVIVKVGSGGKVSLFNSTGASHLIADVSGYYSSASQLVPTVPTRLLDTRTGQGGVVGPTSDAVNVTVTGKAGVPVGATSVIMNVTVTEPSNSGYLTVWPTGASRPTASNLNFSAGQTIPNLVISKIGSEGRITYVGGGAKVHVIIDVLGYIANPTPMTELLNQVDTNNIYGDWDEVTANVQGALRANSLQFTDLACSTSSPQWVEYNLGRQWGTIATTLTFDDIHSDVTAKVRFRIIGDGVPLLDQVVAFGQATDITVSMVNVLRVRFEVTNVNVGGSPCSGFPTFADVRLMAAAGAEFPSQPDYFPLVPGRVLDTREGVGAGKGRVPHNGVVDLVVAGMKGIPTSGAGAVVLNLTVTEPSTSGYFTVYPTGAAQPVASNVNFVGGQTIPNLVIVPIGSNGRISIYNFGGLAHMVADVLGWFPGSVVAGPSSVNLTELLNQVDTNNIYGDWDELTANVQGTLSYNSLQFTDLSCSTSSTQWVEFNLGRQWTSLQTSFTFDDVKSKAGAKMRFRVLGDGVQLADQTVSFGQSVPVVANVSNTLRLRFEVTNANVGGSPCSGYPTFAAPVLSR